MVLNLEQFLSTLMRIRLRVCSALPISSHFSATQSYLYFGLLMGVREVEAISRVHLIGTFIQVS